MPQPSYGEYLSCSPYLPETRGGFSRTGTRQFHYNLWTCSVAEAQDHQQYTHILCEAACPADVCPALYYLLVLNPRRHLRVS
jgi:hypothetical protein